MMEPMDTLVISGRLLLAAALGMAIGIERTYRAKTAGIRTHFLVALGSALFMVVSRYGFGGTGDPGRVAAQIVSGIGFLGAGTIIMQKHVVHGLTTAAGMWVAAGIGMACAAGLYEIAVVATALALVGLELFGRFNRFLRVRSEERGAARRDGPAPPDEQGEGD